MLGALTALTSYVLLQSKELYTDLWGIIMQFISYACSMM